MYEFGSTYVSGCELQERQVVQVAVERLSVRLGVIKGAFFDGPKVTIASESELTILNLNFLLLATNANHTLSFYLKSANVY
jgi:hypothetical protein